MDELDKVKKNTAKICEKILFSVIPAIETRNQQIIKIAGENKHFLDDWEMHSLSEASKHLKEAKRELSLILTAHGIKYTR